MLRGVVLDLTGSKANGDSLNGDVPQSGLPAGMGTRGQARPLPLPQPPKGSLSPPRSPFLHTWEQTLALHQHPLSMQV